MPRSSSKVNKWVLYHLVRREKGDSERAGREQAGASSSSSLREDSLLGRSRGGWQSKAGFTDGMKLCRGPAGKGCSVTWRSEPARACLASFTFSAHDS